MIIDKERVFELKDKRRVLVSPEDQEAIWRGMRPRIMDYKDFLEIRAIMKKELKNYLKGSFYHISKYSENQWAEYTKELGKKFRQRGRTYVKKD